MVGPQVVDLVDERPVDPMVGAVRRDQLDLAVHGIARAVVERGRCCVAQHGVDRDGEDRSPDPLEPRIGRPGDRVDAGMQDVPAAGPQPAGDERRRRAGVEGLPAGEAQVVAGGDGGHPVVGGGVERFHARQPTTGV
jgi:hypothetical protein